MSDCWGYPRPVPNNQKVNLEDTTLRQTYTRWSNGDVNRNYDLVCNSCLREERQGCEGRVARVTSWCHWWGDWTRRATSSFAKSACVFYQDSQLPAFAHIKFCPEKIWHMHDLSGPESDLWRTKFAFSARKRPWPLLGKHKYYISRNPRFGTDQRPRYVQVDKEGYLSELGLDLIPFSAVSKIPKILFIWTRPRRTKISKVCIRHLAW